MNKLKAFTLALALAAAGPALRLQAEGRANPVPVQQQAAPWAAAPFDVITSGHPTFLTADVGHVFTGRKNCIVRVAPELQGLTGVKLPAAQYEKGGYAPLKLRFK